MPILKIFTAVLLSACQVLALEAPIDGYKVVDMGWNIEVHPGEPYKRFTGSLNEIHARVTELNPRWDEQYGSRSTQKRGGATTLQKRDNLICGPGPFNWGWTGVSWVQTNAYYLRGVKGQPRSIGGGNCARVACAMDSAIWWCNDNRDSIVLDSFTQIADCADNIATSCQGEGGYQAVGQLFKDGGWNVVVKDESC
ncbi:hypothetical protein QQS21_008560 [Conoideocrella luteorostrata]|uniref:Secreted protein n=1 Tax=Conoideocrella luteorostrata TaxID=1105319 RepID=A0AAJ0FRB7_9HYPO|nr:hypothetical protein QQS21_008560 [Conoideocrella luteorostrata]